MDDVKVVGVRYANREKTDPSKRVFNVADHVVVKQDAKLGSSRMYVGDEFRATVNTLLPGQCQETHMHPETSHAWFIVSGSGHVELEGGKREPVSAGYFAVHPRNTVHGLYNTGTGTLTYIALSTGV
jgi:mannose-6-phosphate isomerase-like protein (cupin superfamily)